jgi:hypothetical protein
MPFVTVKIVLNLWNDTEHFEDPDRKYNIDSLFEQITKLLILNEIIPIAKESSLIKNLNDYVFPYYKELINKVIPEMYKILTNYNKYIAIDYNNIQVIMCMLREKIKK